MAAEPTHPDAGDASAPPTTNPASDAMLQAAKDAISQLGDLNAMMADAMEEGQANNAAPGAAGPSASGASRGSSGPATIGGRPGMDAGGAKPMDLPSFGASLTPAQEHALDLLSDVNLHVKIELGRTRMLVEDLLRLSEGAVVELDKLAGDPVDVYVNDRHVAKGEVLVLNDNFCVRINEILAGKHEAAGGEGAKGAA